MRASGRLTEVERDALLLAIARQLAGQTGGESVREALERIAPVPPAVMPDPAK